MRWPALLLLPALAHADDGLGIRVETREQAPILVLDPTLESRFETHGADEQHDHAVIPVGHGVDAILDQMSWADQDIMQNGWRSAAGLTRDFGFARLTAMGSYNGIDGRLGDGRYVDLTVALTKTFHLSHWMTAFISLSLSVRQWTGTPPPGERNGATGMLSVGTTFR
jgi:hypothetical protein